MEKPWAARIRDCRIAMGWSRQHQLADMVNALDRTARLDGNTVSRWERGEHKPSEFYVELLCRVFAPLFLLDPAAGNGMDKRSFIRESLGFGVAVGTGHVGLLPWAKVEQPATRVDKATVDGLQRITISLERLEQQVGPGELLGPLTGHLHSMAALLQNSSMTAGLRAHLCSIAGETAGMLAMARAEVGDSTGSAGYARFALYLCHEANDRALGAWVMGCYTATQPAYRGDLELRLRHFTEGAHGFGPQDASPRARAWFAAKAADIHATLGQADASLRALEDADVACQQASDECEERPRHAVLGLDKFWLTSERGASLARLGRSEQAIKALDEALSMAGSDFNHVKPWLVLAKARAYVRDEEPEEACRLAGEVASAAQELNLDVLLGDLRQFHRLELASWAATAAVSSLAERLGHMGARMMRR